MSLNTFHMILITMALIAVVVFVALYYVEAGYGMLFDRKWGPSVNNRLAWVLMEAPVFLVMLGFWFCSPRRFETVPLLFFLFFESHYFRRAFIFPLRIRTQSRMPLSIMSMGILFNLLNGMIQGEWIFYLAPGGMYTTQWLGTPQFIMGTVLFFTGMGVNIHSDRVVRSLRRPGDNAHYLPQKGMFRYVTAGHYFGEIVEWTGFALLTWSWSGAVFALWTCANLIPRAASIHRKYRDMFGDEVGSRKRVIPFIY